MFDSKTNDCFSGKINNVQKMYCKKSLTQVSLHYKLSASIKLNPSEVDWNKYKTICQIWTHQINLNTNIKSLKMRTFIQNSSYCKYEQYDNQHAIIHCVLIIAHLVSINTFVQVMDHHQKFFDSNASTSISIDADVTRSWWLNVVQVDQWLKTN